jgi:hypothetical protein
MEVWLVIVSLSAATGFLCARLFQGTIAWIASGLLPWLGLLASLLYQEYFVPYQGGGASMWPIAQLFAGTVAAVVGLATHAIFRAKGASR